MCLIVRGRIGDLLDLDLDQAQFSNNDGWGVHSGRNVSYSFSSTEKDIIKFLSKRNKSAVATVHFRFATHGSKTIANAHPFNLNDGSYLMHNGVLFEDCFQHKTKSDTMRLAEILMDCGPTARDAMLSMLAESMNYDNKFCVLKGKEWQKYGNWVYDKSTKTWHSNRSILGGWRNEHIPTGRFSRTEWLGQDEFDKLPPASRTYASQYLDDDFAEAMLDENDPFLAPKF